MERGKATKSGKPFADTNAFLLGPAKFELKFDSKFDRSDQIAFVRTSTIDRVDDRALASRVIGKT